MTETDHIKTVYILADGNPSPKVAKFSFTPERGSCSAATRRRLSKTQKVYLLAENNKGQFLMTNAKVKVTMGGSGGKYKE
jgi:Predicted secreted protein